MIFDLYFKNGKFVAAMDCGYAPGASETGNGWECFANVEFDGENPVTVNSITLWNSPLNGVEVFNG